MRNVIARCAAAACAFTALFVVQAYQMHARRDIRSRRLRLYRHTAAADVPPSLLHGFLHESCYRLNDSLAERRRFLHRLAPRRDCGTDLCSAVRRARARWHESGTLVVTLAVWPEQRLLLESFAAAVAALRIPAVVLVEAASDTAFESCRQASDGLIVVTELPRSTATASRLSRKWSALAEVLSMGESVLYADVDAMLTAKPDQVLYKDSDVEAATDSWDDEGARGFIFGSDDPSMGWGAPSQPDP